MKGNYPVGGAMVESVINKLFEYYDNVFFEEKVEVDQRGYMGTHYDGLNLDYYLENSVLGIDYLSIEDYFETTANVKYVETQSLFSQYSNKSLEIKQKVIGAILTLVNSSSYRKEMKKTIMDKSKAFLKRFGLELEDAAGVMQIKNDYKLFEGSYCEIFLFNEQIYKVELNYTEDKKPAFYSNATEFRVILKNLNFTDEVLNEKNEVLDSGRTEMEIKVIKAILSSPRIKQKELAEQVGISVSTIQRTIKKLVKESKIVRVNGKRDGYWKVL